MAGARGGLTGRARQQGVALHLLPRLLPTCSALVPPLQENRARVPLRVAPRCSCSKRNPESQEDSA